MRLQRRRRSLGRATTDDAGRGGHHLLDEAVVHGRAPLCFVIVPGGNRAIVAGAGRVAHGLQRHAAMLLGLRLAAIDSATPDRMLTSTAIYR